MLFPPLAFCQKKSFICQLLALAVVGIGSASVSYYLVESSKLSFVLQDVTYEVERANKTDQTENELRYIRGGRTQRIALMFGGAPRTLTQLGVMTSHVVNVIDALGASGRDIVDVFFHMNNGTTDGVHPSANTDLNVNVEHFTEAILDKLVRLTSPVQVILHTDSSCSGLNGALANHSCCMRASRQWQNNFLQFGYLRESYRTVKAYERDNHLSYDWFIRMRPDVACFESLPSARSLSTRRFYLETKERLHGVNTNDYVFIVPKNLSHAFFEEQIMTIFDTTCPTGMARWPAEESMFTFAPNLPYQALPLACVHVTAPYSAECFRLTRRDQPSIPTVFDIDGSLFGRRETFEQGCTRLVREGYFGNQSHL